MNSTPSIDALRSLLGHWKTSGQVFGDNGEAVGEIAGTDTYQLLPGVPWIAHTVDVDMPDGHVATYELIGGAHPGGGWTMYAFDESSDRPDVMRLTPERDDLLLIHGDGVRSWLSPLAGDDHMQARWERWAGGEWVTWMTMRFDRS